MRINYRKFEEEKRIFDTKTLVHTKLYNIDF